MIINVCAAHSYCFNSREYSLLFLHAIGLDTFEKCKFTKKNDKLNDTHMYPIFTLGSSNDLRDAFLVWGETEKNCFDVYGTTTLYCDRVSAWCAPMVNWRKKKQNWKSVIIFILFLFCRSRNLCAHRSSLRTECGIIKSICARRERFLLLLLVMFWFCSLCVDGTPKITSGIRCERWL